MSNPVNLTKFTIEELQEHINNGAAVKDILFTVIKNMPTREYSSVTNKYETIPERIIAQAELVKHCIDKGVTLKDVFPKAKEIPAEFIENHLPLVIENKYDANEILSHILFKKYTLKDQFGLITALVNEYGADAQKLYYLPSDFNVSTIEFLFSKGMPVATLLREALSSDNREKQKELFDLAFKHGAEVSTFENLFVPVVSYNEDILKILMNDYQVSAGDLLRVVIRAGVDKYNQETQEFEPNPEFIAKQSELAQYLFNNGASLKGALKHVSQIPASFIKNNLELIIEEYGPTEILSYMVQIPTVFNNLSDLLIKLVNDNKAEPNKVQHLSGDLDRASIEFLLSKGMPVATLLREALSSDNREKQKELFDLAFTHGANSSSFKDIGTSIKNCNEELFNNLMNDYRVSAGELLRVIIRAGVGQYDQITKKYGTGPELIVKQTALTNFLIGIGANLQSIDYFPSNFVKNNLQLIIEKQVEIQAGHLVKLTVEEVNTLLKGHLTLQKLFNLVLRAAAITEQLTEEEINKLKSLIDLVKSNNVVTNDIFGEQYLDEDKQHGNIINHDIFEYLLKKQLIDASCALEYAINNKSVDLAELAFNYGANIEAKSFNDEDLTLLDKALEASSIDIINRLLDKGAKHDLSYDAYVKAIVSLSFNDACQLVERLPEIYNLEETNKVLRSYGCSMNQINSFNNLHNLVVDYLAARLSDFEQKILTADTKIEINTTNVSQNIYGYTPLHFAIIADKYDLAKEMIEAGFDMYATDGNGISALQLLSLLDSRRNLSKEKQDDLKKLKKLITQKIDQVDIVFEDGEGLIDSFMDDPELSKVMLSKTKDPLFYFYKSDDNLFGLAKDPEKVHIAISNGEGFWSTGMWAAARLIMKAHQDVEFHLVSYDMLEKGGDKFIEQFDAFINPGAGDTYPKHLPEFTKKDCKFSMELEQLYQLVLQKTEELNIPYLGMCAGAQHFALHHQGTLAPLKGYNKGQHEVEFIKGTKPYFLSLTPEQQEQALKAGVFPEVKFKGDTAHNFAAVSGKLGQGMKLGAVSEGGIPMSYAHENGLRYATQYHPEHYYTDEPHGAPQKAWLDNFVAIARLHHNSKVHGTVSPIEYLQFVEQQLSQFPLEGEAVKPLGEGSEG